MLSEKIWIAEIDANQLF